MKKKRLLIVLFLFLLCTCSFYLYQSTYAKYRKKVIQQVDITLANWDIKLNDESIAGKNTVSGNITPIFVGSEYVADNVLAPGSTGYFDINIDATNVDVSFSYTLDVVVNNQDSYPDIISYGYTLDPDNNSDILDIPDTGIYGTIEHNNSSTKLRIYIKWDDSSTSSMDNAQDTALAIANDEILMNATFTFTQINN